MTDTAENSNVEDSLAEDSGSGQNDPSVRADAHESGTTELD